MFLVTDSFLLHGNKHGPCLVGYLVVKQRLRVFLTQLMIFVFLTVLNIIKIRDIRYETNYHKDLIIK